ncbi:MAG: hypothetical protein PHX87_04885 [Candidatus Peribacteraceae bacterium]|nr:hypothetical protein [Candidatus Peribacteraceae bacterium]MDD5742731.1 hypothetical protein [Candidatus Peribacteraceae bacterium]
MLTSTPPLPEGSLPEKLPVQQSQVPPPVVPDMVADHRSQFADLLPPGKVPQEALPEPVQSEAPMQLPAPEVPPAIGPASGAQELPA